MVSFAFYRIKNVVEKEESGIWHFLMVPHCFQSSHKSFVIFFLSHIVFNIRADKTLDCLVKGQHCISKKVGKPVPMYQYRRFEVGLPVNFTHLFYSISLYEKSTQASSLLQSRCTFSELKVKLRRNI